MKISVITWIMVLLSLFALSETVVASDIDCNLLSCGFGTAVATRSETEPLDLFQFTQVNSTTTTVYLRGGVYTYLYEVTQSASVPIKLFGVIVLGFAPTPWNTNLNWGMVTDLTTAGMVDCGDTSGVGCDPLGFGIGNGKEDGSINTLIGFQWPGKASFGTGISPPGARSTYTFAFYGQANTGPAFGDAGASWVAPDIALVGGFIPPVLVPSSVPEPATLVMFGSGIIGLAGVFRRRLMM